ncbi:Hypothetical protein D9617_23g005900 [Elsinoe fawcettii]|nr:Hypothetical protein D9617_23g005900 [Elsinoe fawcettii]
MPEWQRRLMSELSAQAGPAWSGSDLRDYHSIFKDVDFRDRLVEQIQGRLNSITTNWGELHCMELIIALSSRFLALTKDLDKSNITDALNHGEMGCNWLRKSGLWPTTSVTELLSLLRSCNSDKLDLGIREMLINLALNVTQIQRLKRTCSAYRKNDSPTLRAELANPGHQNWEPAEHSDWLLIGIDGNVMIRPEQVDVARAIINPSSGSNSVLQMNMGQGKTSVIVPLALAALASTSKIARLIVPRQLISMKTVQVVQSRLSTLAGRQVSHLTFN